MLTSYLEQSHVARTVLDVGAVLFVVGEVAQTLRGRRTARGDVWSEVVFRAFFFPGILMLPIGAVLVPAARFGGGIAVFVLGAVVGWAGLLLRWWSFVTLGAYFTTVVKTSSDQRIIDRGPYRVLRHPSYTGMLLAFVGCGLALDNWVAIAGSFLVTLTGLVYRIRHEEHALAAAVGDTYRDFAKNRARLVPFVW